LSPAEVAARMPPDAKRDLLEWGPSPAVGAFIGVVLLQEFPPQSVLYPNPDVVITDDDPMNEYYLLRRWKLGD
jgi:hypothetical protein